MNLGCIRTGMQMSKVLRALAKTIYISNFYTFKNRLFKAVLFSQHKLEEARQIAIETSVSSKRFPHLPTRASH